jgi:hypothetical protein
MNMVKIFTVIEKQVHKNVTHFGGQIPKGFGKFVVVAHHNSAENQYVQSMKVNGKPWDKTRERGQSRVLTHFKKSDFMRGVSPAY